MVNSLFIGSSPFFVSSIENELLPSTEELQDRSLDENQAGTTLSRFLLDGFLLHWSLPVTV
jgi:hypothetical protein